MKKPPFEIVHKAYEKLVRKLARSMVEPRIYEDAVAAGLLGLYEAWKRFDPATGKQFAPKNYIRHQIRTCRDSTQYWRKEGNRGKSPERQKQREAAKRQRYMRSLDTCVSVDGEDESKVESIRCERLNPEERLLAKEELAAVTTISARRKSNGLR
jgi:RNA polymerase sigma factor (sigma-70 family)